jgi:hypothetical protein
MSIGDFPAQRLLLRSAFAALALLGGVLCGRAAEAATIYTYSFVQAGYIYSLGAGTRYATTLVGGFSGTSNPIGHINLGTLSDFHVAFDSNPFGAGPGIFYRFYSGQPDYFSFQIGDTSGSTLAFQSPLNSPSFISEVCVGVAVSALCSGGTARGIAGSPGFGVFAASTIAPTVTLVSATVATTPLPAALLLFATGLGGLGAIAARRKRSVAV